jgi:mediator of RNA polymerase II transcription subunit 13, fungi type
VEYSTPVAQQVFTAVNELLTQSHITVHLVPDVLVYHSEALARHPVVGADRIVLNVYDRLGRRVEREHARLSTSHQSQLVVHAHAFTLARSRPLKILYQDQWPPLSQMPFDRHTFLHVAYGWSKDREWIVASLVTERGDNQDRFVGSGGEDLSSNDLVYLVWSFMEQFAKKAGVEWRIVISKLGLICEEELEGNLLSKP